MGDVKYWDGEDFTVLDSKNAKSVNGIKFRINEDILEYSNDGLTWNTQSNFSGSYNDLSDKPAIPINISELTNDSGYVAQAGLDNRVRFITETQYDTLKTNNDIEENITYIIYR